MGWLSPFFYFLRSGSTCWAPAQCYLTEHYKTGRTLWNRSTDVCFYSICIRPSSPWDWKLTGDHEKMLAWLFQEQGGKERGGGLGEGRRGTDTKEGEGEESDWNDSPPLVRVPRDSNIPLRWPNDQIQELVKSMLLFHLFSSFLCLKPPNSR